MAPAPLRWVWRKAERASLARFVNADCAAGVVPKIALPVGVTGHDAVQSGDRRVVLRAIYDAVAGLDIDYDIEGYTFDGQHSQVVRSPVTIERRRRATCLDLALFFAGLALDQRLRPLVVVLEGHALMAVVDSAFALDVGPATTRDDLLAWIDAGDVIPVETTGATRGAAVALDFDDAVARGEEVIGRRDLLFALDPYHLQRHQGLVPARATVSRRAVTVASVAVALVLACGGAATWWLTRPGVPVFDRDKEGVLIPAIPGAEAAGTWIKDGLNRAQTHPEVVAAVAECQSGVQIQAMGPDEAKRIDRSDPANPSNVDVVLHGRTEAVSGKGQPYVGFTIEPFSPGLASHSETAWLSLVSSPALVNPDENALNVMPELKALPPLIMGLREMRGASDKQLKRAECLFDAADRILSGEEPREQKYRASAALFAGNAYILRASGVPESEEQEPLTKAKEKFQHAVDVLREGEVPEGSESMAIVRAAQYGVETITAITDDGKIDPATSDADVRALMGAIDEAARTVQDSSPPVFVALRAMNARLLLGLHGRTSDAGLVREALAETEKAVPVATRITEDGGQRQAAELFAVRGMAFFVAEDIDASIAEFDKAVRLATGTLERDYSLLAAGVRVVRCTGEDRRYVWDALRETELHMQSYPKESLRKTYTKTRGIAEQFCAQP